MWYAFELGWAKMAYNMIYLCKAPSARVGQDIWYAFELGTWQGWDG